jgi:hypothetical protein
MHSEHKKPASFHSSPQEALQAPPESFSTSPACTEARTSRRPTSSPWSTPMRAASSTRRRRRAWAIPARTLAVACYQAQSLARYAAVAAAAREADAFRVKRPRPERFRAARLH